MVQTTIEQITPEIAKEYLKSNNVNRKQNERYIEFYARIMKEGKWLLNGESIVFDNKGNLLDGQHRLMAVIKADVTIQSIVVRNVDNEAFKTIDQGKARSASDTFSIKGIPNYIDVAAGIRLFIIMNRSKLGSLNSSSCGSGSKGKYKISAQEHMEIYERNHEFWQNEVLFAKMCHRRYKILAISEITGISAYLQLIHGYTNEVVHNFFVQIFFDECTNNNTLAIFRRIVVQDLMSTRKMTGLYKTQLLIKCWKAYKTNTELKCLKWSQDKESVLYFD